MLDSGGVTRTKALGSERMARKLRDALPGGDGALRAAVWEFMRPMLSPALVELNRDAFVVDESVETTVDLDGHRAASDLDELALDDEPDAERSVAPSPCLPVLPPGHQARAGGPAAPPDANHPFFPAAGRSSTCGSPWLNPAPSLADAKRRSVTPPDERIRPSDKRDVPP